MTRVRQTFVSIDFTIFAVPASCTGAVVVVDARYDASDKVVIVGRPTSGPIASGMPTWLTQTLINVYVAVAVVLNRTQTAYFLDETTAARAICIAGCTAAHVGV